MGEGLSHWSSMVLRKSQTCFFDRHTHPNSMYSNFCHVLNSYLYSTTNMFQYFNEGKVNSKRFPFTLNAIGITAPPA